MKLLLALRALALIQAAATCLQPLLAGIYLHGTSGAIRIHEPIGLGLTSLAVVELALAAIWWRRGGPWSAPATMLAVTAGFGFQVHAGFDRQLAVHIPLGLALVGSTVAFACWCPRRSQVPA